MTPAPARDPGHLTLALPKGRILEDATRLLSQAGLPLTMPEKSRALRHEFPGVTVLELRNQDVPVYVDLGVADAGIVGKDVLIESGRTVYEPVDLKFAGCRLSLIREVGADGDIARVGTKYPRAARAYLNARGIPAEIVKLSGNIELACLTGLADAVVDLVQTGSTLRANNLEEVDVLFHSTARLVVNRAALKTRRERLRPLIERLRELTSA
ncbi:ATP phosphoribosyltransferase [Deinococcus soli (ex Cha et al. 2016)]|uniref:ATP phosphoribosyltransferase n=2 Tax=Deinococcus soli (ex Cha et al. 2016) TaxID=1309411 RepID=A0AAE3X965_9DEIO|nr:ATP phosphoribosyltransferase [Deinococcus soli (ex Cha et al. 2016)]MDR6216856.1 ATP phosphoribosyltransferase [Deinococcus soli (ex Cha et al. 2016)]MDR6327677.1 ATP phosphoribosyltransferase [Deinococcus soli (ex Cha et al. 2016)]MDR6749952.1 ATP phosphoribosyltransferase [Deinococcus soli (ex Cha et al. 2016)]